MSLTDIMGNADLSVYPIAAMVLFLGVFVLVLLRTLVGVRPGAMKHFAAIALEEGDVAPAPQKQRCCGGTGQCGDRPCGSGRCAPRTRPAALTVNTSTIEANGETTS